MLKINDYFRGFAVKVLAEVDVNKAKSNQHEFNGSGSLRKLLGAATGKVAYPARIAYLDDDSLEAPDFLHSVLTWYDSRANDPKRSAEYRLYYPAEADPVIEKAVAGDTLFLIQEKNESLILVIVRQGSTVLKQLEWVLAVEEEHEALFVDTNLAEKPERSEVASQELLALLGLDARTSEDQYLDEILARFGADSWPKTADFSKFARSKVTGTNAVSDPDGALLRWSEMEHRLFRTLEKHHILDRVARGFKGQNSDQDIEDFMQFSLSVHNRRKSRVGHSFEQHIGTVLDNNNVKFATNVKTEGQKVPDFLFPSGADYHNEQYPSEHLLMLGAKVSLKDRWRQVLNEADRIKNKHLITLAPAISDTQLAEMTAAGLTLVVPAELQVSGYTDSQRSQLLTFKEFIELVKRRTDRAEYL